MREASFLREQNAKPIWHPMASPSEMHTSPPKIIVKAEGVHVVDVDGRRLLDAVGGLWNVNLGYSAEPVKRAIRDQLDVLPYYSGFRGTSTSTSIELAYELTQFFATEGIVRVFFSSGGSDSVETALKLARQYWKACGQRDRTKFISLRCGYHGTHFGGASVTGSTNFRRNYEPLLPGCYHIPSPWTYRNPFGESDPERLAQLCAKALEDEISLQGPDTVAAFIMEPVQGAGGVIVPPAGFMSLARAICDKHDVLFIADEVVTAFGRTGSWSGSRHAGVRPDMMCVAKAITSGYFPLGATLVGEKIAAVLEEAGNAFGSIGHGYTYSGHPVGCAAGLAALAETRRLKLDENAAVRGSELLAGLETLRTRHSLIGDLRGRGLMAALELVADRGKKTPVAKSVMKSISDHAYEAGVMIRVSGSNIILSPPLVITAAEVATIVAALDSALAEAR